MKRLIVRRLPASKVFNLKKKHWSFWWQVFAAMQWKKVHSDHCLQGAWNVCLQSSWWNLQDFASWCLRKFSKSCVNRYKHLPSREANPAKPAKLEFSNFRSTSVKENKDSFVKLDKETDRVDTWQFFLDTNKLVVLWKLLKILMILSHGQATVEKGFSVNGKLLVENLHTESLIAQRHIHNHKRSYDLQAHNLDIARELLESARKKDRWQRNSLLKIVRCLNWMKRCRS